MRAFSRDAGARGWKLPHAPEHEQGTHYFQSPYDDAVCFSCSATGEWDDMLRAKSKKLRSLERKAEAATAAAATAATEALAVRLAAERAEKAKQRVIKEAKRALNAEREARRARATVEAQLLKSIAAGARA